MYSITVEYYISDNIGPVCAIVRGYFNKTAELSQRRPRDAPIYGCPEKFRESSLRTRLLFPKFV